MQQTPLQVRTISFTPNDRATEDGVHQLRMRISFTDGTTSGWLPTILPHVNLAVWKKTKNKHVPETSPAGMLLSSLEEERKRIRGIVGQHFTTGFDKEKFKVRYKEGTSAVIRHKDKTNLFSLFEKKAADTDNPLERKTIQEDMVAYRSIDKYWVSIGNETNSIKLEDTNKTFLNGYLKWLKQTTESPSTWRKYLSVLKSIWNNAIVDGVANAAALYPFSRTRKDNGFKIPSGESAKAVRCLTPDNYVKLIKFRNELPTLIARESNLNTKAKYKGWIKAIDAFQFSFLCNGANPVDFCYLTWSNKQETNDGEPYFQWDRSKTANESKPSKQTAPVAPLLPLIDKYSKHGYLFCIFEINEWQGAKLVPRLITGAEEQEQRRKNWQHKQVNRLKEIAVHLGLPNNVLHFGVARTSWINLGKPFQQTEGVISFGAGHKSESTTRKNYSVEDAQIGELLEINKKLAKLHETYAPKKRKKYQTLEANGKVFKYDLGDAEAAEQVKEEMSIQKHLEAFNQEKDKARGKRSVAKPKGNMVQIKNRKTA